jgi:hypothetical protein
MRLLFVSVTTTTPLEGITATPEGREKLSVRVVTTPRGVTSRMRLLFVSATTIKPLEGITATPPGSLKRAAVPVPSANAPLPLPASDKTLPLFCRAELPTTSVIACGEMPTPTSPAAPHSSTAELVLGAAHLTHALALKATFPPLGSADGAPAPATLR